MKKTDFFNENIKYGSTDKSFIEILKIRDPREVKHVLEVAEQVLNHEFIFDMEWDMERTYEPVRFKDVIAWEYQPGDDSEFVWQFNRHRFLICLGQAYQMTGDEKYAGCLLDLLLQFVRNEKISETNRTTTWRILEIGIRSGNWIKALYLIKDSELLKDDLLTEIYASMNVHARTIMSEHYPYCYAGNWGILENHGLFLLGAMLHQNEITRKYLHQAIEVLDIALLMQIMPDGMQLEQSPMYLNEVLRCLLELLWIGKTANIDLPERMVKTVYHMAEASRNFMKPDGHQLTMGDSDDMDVRPIMELAACVFEDGSFKKMGNAELSYESLWFMGNSGEEIYQKLTSCNLQEASSSLNDSGHTFFRTSWNKKADLLHFDAGLLGTSHGHSDALHIDWIVDGTDVLIDPGRYTYVDKPERYEFKETQAHNTIQVDGKNFCLWDNSWVSKSVMSQTSKPMIKRNDMEYVQGAHTGYMSLDNPVYITRKVLHICPEIYVIVDECYTSGSHSYRQLFHFDSRGIVEQFGHKVRFTNGDVQACVLMDEDGITSLFSTRQSYHYNQLVENRSAQCIKQGNGFVSFCTVLVKGNGENLSVEKIPVRSSNTQEVIKQELAEGMKIHYHGKTFLLVLAHTEMPGPVDLYQVEDCVGCGNVIVFELEKSKVVGTVLNW